MRIGTGFAESDGGVPGCSGVRNAGGSNGDGAGIRDDCGGEVIAVAYDGADRVVAARDAVHRPSHAGVEVPVTVAAKTCCVPARIRPVGGVT